MTLTFDLEPVLVTTKFVNDMIVTHFTRGLYEACDLDL